MTALYAVNEKSLYSGKILRILPPFHLAFIGGFAMVFVEKQPIYQPKPKPPAGFGLAL
ncbi:Hypothetical protein AJF4211_001400 [Avibacterium paragallinarum JF4211]|nr:Hypothetical protein AJF4211_001400 [Avibacterium paragallinarum JF4211]